MADLIERFAKAGKAIFCEKPIDLSVARVRACLKVVAETKALKLASWPGVLTPSECFGALKAGAVGLKIFPCSVVGPAGIKAMRAVLPDAVGVTTTTLRPASAWAIASA